MAESCVNAGGGGTVRSGERSADLRVWCCPAARRGVRPASESRCCGGGYQPSHSDKVVGCCDQIARQLGPLQATVTRPPKPANRLHPAKDLLDPLADALADGVPNVPCGASV